MITTRLRRQIGRASCRVKVTGVQTCALPIYREDNDPARFLLYLCAAMESIAPAAAAPVRALLQAAEQTSLEAALTLLLNGIAGLDQPITLVLDDYHEIEAADRKSVV